MSVIALNVPTDIVWERICVTEDMMDPHACDSDMPPKWQTSMALFKYTPKDEYQLYEKRRIVYYKLVATIGSYQPEADEIEGAIDWSRVHVQDVHDFQERLKSYLPCHGALIQVTAAPPKTHGVAIRDYPYFLDCQPKQRALYEQATDYNERSSRSLESVNVTKGGAPPNRRKSWTSTRARPSVATSASSARAPASMSMIATRRDHAGSARRKVPICAPATPRGKRAKRCRTPRRSRRCTTSCRPITWAPTG